MTATPPTTCLVVSDHRLIRWSLVEFLMARGLEACSTLSKDLAVALLQVRPFDLLIVDPSEPGTSELLRRSQNLPRRPQIILLVDNTSAPSPITSEQRGVLGVIHEPILLASLGQLLARISDTRIGSAA